MPNDSEQFDAQRFRIEYDRAIQRLNQATDRDIEQAARERRQLLDRLTSSRT